MFCKNCGSKNNDSAIFCGKCGGELVNNQVKSPVSSQTNPVSVADVEKPVRKKKGLPYTVVGFAGGLAATFAVIAFAPIFSGSSGLDLVLRDRTHEEVAVAETEMEMSEVEAEANLAANSMEANSVPIGEPHIPEPAVEEPVVEEPAIEATLAGTEIRLQDLEWFNASGSDGGFDYNESARDNLGNTYTNGIEASSGWGSNFQEYRIEGRFRELKGRIVLRYDDRAKHPTERIYLLINGDGSLLYQSPDIVPGIEPIDFSVDLTGIQDLRIEIVHGLPGYLRMLQMVDTVLVYN